jgi:hypothetical protein
VSPLEGLADEFIVQGEVAAAGGAPVDHTAAEVRLEQLAHHAGENEQCGVVMREDRDWEARESLC